MAKKVSKKAEAAMLRKALERAVGALKWPSVYSVAEVAEEGLAALNAVIPPEPEGKPCSLHSSHWEWRESEGRWGGFCERCLSE